MVEPVNEKESALSAAIQIRMGGYGPPTTAFSQALKFIGDRIEARFADRVEIEYVYNIMDLGHRGEDILTLVEDGELTLGYQSSSYLTDRVGELGFADLPFLFRDNDHARATMDGALGRHLTEKIEAGFNYRILGYFENGFRHLSNRLRPVRRPEDLTGMKIRVLPSDVQARTFQLLGATPLRMDLTEAIDGVVNGTLDAQENPFANTVTYGVHKFHRFHTMTGHFYLSRPIFAHRQSVDAWPDDLKAAMDQAVQDAVVFQRGLSEQEAIDARKEIEAEGGAIVELAADEHQAFADAVRPQYTEARDTFGDEMFRLAGL
ncbi:MAG: TRAP transporter substrate-binding protein [Proteobacteria bacterium]|nr:TRAP transporter substrate-binding protein [Pseudomonadota bacterium]